jgi:hypothetical protein
MNREDEGYGLNAMDTQKQGGINAHIMIHFFLLLSTFLCHPSPGNRSSCDRTMQYTQRMRKVCNASDAAKNNDERCSSLDNCFPCMIQDKQEALERVMRE